MESQYIPPTVHRGIQWTTEEINTIPQQMSYIKWHVVQKRMEEKKETEHQENMLKRKNTENISTAKKIKVYHHDIKLLSPSTYSWH